MITPTLKQRTLAHCRGYSDGCEGRIGNPFLHPDLRREWEEGRERGSKSIEDLRSRSVSIEEAFGCFGSSRKGA